MKQQYTKPEINMCFVELPTFILAGSGEDKIDVFDGKFIDDESQFLSKENISVWDDDSDDE